MYFYKQMKKIKTVDELQKILKENEEKCVVLKFGAEWCGPCRLMENVIKNLEKDSSLNTVFVECDVDEVDDEDGNLLEKYNVRNMPLTIIYKGGLITDRIVGAVSEIELRRKIS